MVFVPSYVYPASGIDELIQSVTDQLRAFLEAPDGSTSDALDDALKDQAAAYAAAGSFVGLNTSPVFTLRAGSGAAGDLPVTDTAKIIYLDDDSPGKPFVRLVLNELGPPEDWGDRILQPMAFTVDHDANEFNGAITGGVNSNDATAALSGVTWRLLSMTKKSYPLLKTWGFNNPGTRAGAPFREGINLTAPFTFGCDIYYRQP